MIGNKVAKVFEDGKLYRGLIVAFNKPYWKVEYQDGDKEDFDWKELKKGMEVYNKDKEKEEQENERKAKRGRT